MKHKTSSVEKGYGVFLIPGIVAFLIIIIFRFMINIGISLTKWSGVRAPVWIGLSNFQQLIGDAVFWLSFRNILILLVAMIGAIVLTHHERPDNPRRQRVSQQLNRPHGKIIEVVKIQSGQGVEV